MVVGSSLIPSVMGQLIHLCVSKRNSSPSPHLHNVLQDCLNYQRREQGTTEVML